MYSYHIHPPPLLHFLISRAALQFWAISYFHANYRERSNLIAIKVTIMHDKNNSTRANNRQKDENDQRTNACAFYLRATINRSATKPEPCSSSTDDCWRVVGTTTMTTTWLAGWLLDVLEPELRRARNVLCKETLFSSLAIVIIFGTTNTIPTVCAEDERWIRRRRLLGVAMNKFGTTCAAHSCTSFPLTFPVNCILAPSYKCRQTVFGLIQQTVGYGEAQLKGN